MTERRIKLGGFDIHVVDCMADINVLPLGHIFVDSQEKMLSPVATCYPKIMRAMYDSPTALVEILERVERVVQVLFPLAAPDVDWYWELPGHKSCPNCCC